MFILSRIKELHDAGASTEDAIRLAITRTAGTVTSAAMIMVAVFGLFATLSLIHDAADGLRARGRGPDRRDRRPRGALPSTMKLLGEWNWYLPRWLTWLPSLSPESDGKRRLRRPTALPQ